MVHAMAEDEERDWTPREIQARVKRRMTAEKLDAIIDAHIVAAQQANVPSSIFLFNAIGYKAPPMAPPPDTGPKIEDQQAYLKSYCAQLNREHKAGVVGTLDALKGAEIAERAKALARDVPQVAVGVVLPGRPTFVTQAVLQQIIDEDKKKKPDGGSNGG